MTVPPTSPFILYTIENPWPAAAIASILIWLLTTRSDRRHRTGLAASLALTLLAAGLPLLARLVESDAEFLRRRTFEFIHAAVAGDAGPVSEILAAPPTPISLLVGSSPTNLDRPGIISRIPNLPALIIANHVQQLVAGVRTDDPNVAESVVLQSTTTVAGPPISNQWRFTWSRAPGSPWRITQLSWERWRINEIPSPADLGRW